MGRMSTLRTLPEPPTAIGRSRDTRPDGTLRAFLAGVEGSVFAWLCVVVPAVASYVATAAAPALGDATWLQAAAVGSALWQLAHGGAVTAGDVMVTLVPLGVSGLALALATLSMRRASLTTWTGVLSATLGYAVAALLLASLPPAQLSGLAGAAAGAVVLGGAAAVLAVTRRRGVLPPLPEDLYRQVMRVPREVRSVLVAGGRGAGAVSGTLLALGALFVVVSVVANHTGVSAALDGLRVDGFDVAMLLVATVLLVPTAAVWAVGWLAGTGFTIGAGSVFSPETAVTGPLPAFPLLAGLPGPSPVGGWTAALVVLVGAAAGWYLHLRAPQSRLWASATTAVVTALGTGLVFAVLGSAASGSVGPGRMAEVGLDPGAMALRLTGLVALGCLAVVVAARPDTLATARRGLVRSRDAARAVPGRLSRSRA